MHIQPFQAFYPIMDLIPSPDHFFSSIKEKFSEYYEGGFYTKLPQEGFYIHQIEARHRTFLGLIACVDIQDYIGGFIKRHENTIASSEQEQMRQMLFRNAQTKPVLLTYRNNLDITDLLKNYTNANEAFLRVKFEEPDELHTFWEISNGPEISRIQALFLEQVSQTYIADGHHRTSTMAKMFQRYGAEKPDNPYRWLVAAFYPTAELEIHDFNRIISGLTDLSPTVFMAKLSKLFEIQLLEHAEKPRQKHELTMLIDNEWYRLNWRPRILEKFKSEPVLLDVNLLNQKVLKNILGIQNIRNDYRIRYIQGTKGLDNVREKTMKSDERLAFCLYPVSMDDFLAVSEADGVLPPKSTWFEPRIRSGLIVKQYTT